MGLRISIFVKKILCMVWYGLLYVWGSLIQKWGSKS